MGVINNAKDQPLFAKSGTVPDMSGAMQDYFQSMVFERVSKVVNGFQVVETGDPVAFRGVVQPFNERSLFLKPEGQRAWTWLLIHSDPTLTLDVDDVGIFKGKQTRIMARKDFALYGYIEYHAVQDYTGAGP